MTDGEYQYLAAYRGRQGVAVPIIGVVFLAVILFVPATLYYQSRFSGAPLSMLAVVVAMVFLVPSLGLVFGVIALSARASAKALQRDLSGREVLVIAGQVTAKRKVQNKGVRHMVDVGSRSFNVSALGIFDAVQVGMPLVLRVGPVTGRVLSGLLNGGQWVMADLHSRPPGERGGAPPSGYSVQT